jgi:hypothetical protein
MVAAGSLRADASRVRLGALHPAAWGVALYLVLTILTHVHLTGDAPEYAGEIYDRLRTGKPGPGFWDAGHLAWRPLIAGLVYLGSLVGVAGGDIALSTVSRALIATSWLGGLLCALLFPLWLLRLGVSSMASVLATITLLSANAFLSYGHGGSSYIPALACLIAGLYLLSAQPLTPRSSVGAGLLLAGAVLLWLPFVLALPGAFLLPVLLREHDREWIRPVAYATATCAVAGFATYAIVAAHLGVASPASFLTWFSGASHGVTGNAGVARAALGFSRSFLNMGTDGAVLKRFLVHDPYNPVSVAALVGLGWKVAFFYLVIAVTLVSLWPAPWRRFLVFFLVSAIPVLLFGIAWQGGDTERYLPLYPALLLAVAASITRSSWRSLGRILPVAFALLSLVVNTTAYSRANFAAEEDTIVTRLGEFDDSLLPPGSILVVPTFNDRTGAYFRSGTVDFKRLRGSFGFHGLVEKGSVATPQWRESFSKRALDVWDAGGRVWVSRRVLSPTPAADWDWVEGDDRRVSWSDFPGFFAPFELGATRGGADGFVELLPTPTNRSRLRATLTGA